MRPVDKGTSPYCNIATYQDAEPYLNGRIGRYCSFCEMPIFHAPEVEHKESKKKGGDLTKWENLLYSCKYCNTRKGIAIKRDESDKWLWPDQNNTFLTFTYKDGQPRIEKEYLKTISIEVYERAKALFDGVALDFQPKGIRDKDKRWIKRIETLGIAEDSKTIWLKTKGGKLEAEELKQITTLAKACGFFFYLDDGL